MKTFIASIAIVALAGAGVGLAAQAATEAGVAATVTVQNISVTVTDGVVEYAIKGAGLSQDTTVSDLDDTQTANNNGNITEDLNIRGTTSSPGTWTLAATAAGATNYKHEFSKDAFGTAGTALTLSNQLLASSVASSTGQTFDLKITTPPGATDFTEQTVNVTVQATASS